MKVAAILAFLSLALAAPAIRKRDAPAPLVRLQGQKPVPNKYIVKLRDGTSLSALEALLKQFPETESQVYNKTSFKGFASELCAESLKTIQNDFDVEYIEEDGYVSIKDTAILDKKAYTTQSGADYGLQRISHKSRTATGYVYDTSAGSGTCAYIIDTGIYAAHSDFGGRATFLKNYAGDGSNTDGNGHGTHVSGTIGGTTYGVAKLTKLYGVKVLDADGSGTNSGVISGINYVTSDVATRSCPNGAVANLSLGGTKSAAVNTAVAKLVRAGVFLAVAAGNENQNAANTSPASEPTVFTVGASTSTDAKASYSNYGSIVDLFAPGDKIKSAWIGSTSATNTISGTSMASPHIAGLGAYLLGLNGKQTPAALSSSIISLSTKNVITGVPSGTTANLAFNGNPSG